MAASYRLPRRYRYRYRSKSDSKGPLVVVAAVAALMAASGAKAAAHHGTSATLAVRAVPASSNEALANRMAASGYGWTGIQASCLDDLWTEESGFSAYAANSTSDARGIPQNIDGWSAGYQPGDAAQQITWGLSYISGRYGNPCAAWSFETSHVPNWY